jgi:hypothetical protein
MMGLDGVELILRIEETFSIEIDNRVVGQISTVGQCADIITQMVSGMQSSDCPSAKAFYCLRRSFIKMFGIQRNAVRPSTPVMPLLPLWGRTRIWKTLERELALRLPRLQNQAGKGVGWGFLIAFFLVFFSVSVMTRDIVAALMAAMLASLFGVLFGYIVGILLIPITLPSQYQTLGGLARGLVA